MLSGEATYTNFIVFSLSWSGLESTIYRTAGEYAYHNCLVEARRQKKQPSYKCTKMRRLFIYFTRCGNQYHSIIRGRGLVNKTGGSRLFFGICFQFSLDIVKICLEKVGFQSNKTKKKKKGRDQFLRLVFTFLPNPFFVCLMIWVSDCCLTPTQ